MLSKNVVARVPVRFCFFQYNPFSLCIASISHLLTVAVKCSCFSYNKIRLHCFLSIALSGSSSSSNSFSVSEDIKICLKRRLVCVIVFSLYMSSWLCDLLLKYPRVAFGLPYNIS